MLRLLTLDDFTIRNSLKTRLKKQGLASELIFDELAVNRGIAIADIVAFFEKPHCFEIKSDIDSLTRLEKQSYVYSSSFPKVSLVTTEKHISQAIKIIPAWWGLILAKKFRGKVTLKYLRKSSTNPVSTKEYLSRLLWNSELKHELKKRNIRYTQKSARAELSNLLAENTSQELIFKLVRGKLLERKQAR